MNESDKLPSPINDICSFIAILCLMYPRMLQCSRICKKIFVFLRNLDGSKKPRPAEAKMEYYDNRIVMTKGRVECQIIADKVDDMEPYIRTLFNWSATAWNYSAVEDWNTDEFSHIHDQRGFFLVHTLVKDDKDALFQGKYEWSPEPLKDYKYREIQAIISIKISEHCYNELI